MTLPLVVRRAIWQRRYARNPQDPSTRGRWAFHAGISAEEVAANPAMSRAWHREAGLEGYQNRSWREHLGWDRVPPGHRPVSTVTTKSGCVKGAT